LLYITVFVSCNEQNVVCKGKGLHVTCHAGTEGELRNGSTQPKSPPCPAGRWITPTALPSRKSPDIQCTKCWVGPCAGMEGCREEKNILPTPGFKPRNFQSIVSRHTDCAIRQLIFMWKQFKCRSSVHIVPVILCNKDTRRTPIKYVG